MKLQLPKRQPRPIPTRAELDKRNPRRTALTALLIAGFLLAAGIAWWAKNGARLLADIAFHAETLYLYWTLVASPLDRKVWLGIGIALLAAAIGILALFHRFVWRALFPDFKRLDARMHRGGRPEPLGRLYRVVEFRDGERIRYRHQYKQGSRWFPLFRFDHVDLDAPAEPGLFGESIVLCGRLERDPSNRFRRIVSFTPFPTHALEDDFRSHEVHEDQRRKTNIVGPGPGTNPDVMRRKWQGEHSIMPNIRRRELPKRPASPPAPPAETPREGTP